MFKYVTLYILPLIIYASFIIYLSSISEVPTIRGLITNEPIPTGAWTGDEIEHTIEYGILAFLFYRAIIPTRYKRNAFVATIIFAVLFGFFDELHQFFVPKRSFSTIDLWWDFIGSLTTRVSSNLLNRLWWLK